jgi:putative DNA primase/helicase
MAGDSPASEGPQPLGDLAAAVALERAAAVAAVLEAAEPRTAEPGSGSDHAAHGRDEDDAGPADGPDDGDGAWPDADEPPPEGVDMEAVRACAALDPSDTDNGQRLMAHFGQDLRVVARQAVSGGDWIGWVGTHWDMANGVARAELTAQQLGPRIKLEAAFIPARPAELRAIDAAQPFARKRKADLSEAEMGIVQAGARAKAAWAGRQGARIKFGVSCKNAARMKNALHAAAPHLRVPPKALNAAELTIATLTHTLTLRRELDMENPDADGQRWRGVCTATPGHRREDMITALMPVRYDPLATCPKFMAFLEKQLPDEGKRRTLQQFTGLGLTGLKVQRILFHYGAGANGKSVFMETISRLCGEAFAVSLPAESITGAGGRNAGGASPDLIRLFGKRILRVSELPAGKPVDIELIKRLTGGEDMAVRDMYLGYIEFSNRAKAHWSGNDKPQLDGSDYAIFRRLLLLHWNVIIPEEDRRDFDVVVGEFMEEASGILNWMIAGACDYLAGNEMFVAEAIEEDTEEYRLEMDPAGAFFSACLASQMGMSLPFSEIYDAYQRWCAAAGRNEPKSKNSFGRKLKKRFKCTVQNGLPVYHDIALVNVPARNPEDDQGRPYNAYRDAKL